MVLSAEKIKLRTMDVIAEIGSLIKNTIAVMIIKIIRRYLFNDVHILFAVKLN